MKVKSKEKYLDEILMKYKKKDLVEMYMAIRRNYIVILEDNNKIRKELQMIWENRK